MSSLKMSLGLRIRSKVNWVQNNKALHKTPISMPSHASIAFIKFTEIIQNVLRILVYLIHSLDKN